MSSHIYTSLVSGCATAIAFALCAFGRLDVSSQSQLLPSSCVPGLHLLTRRWRDSVKTVGSVHKRSKNMAGLIFPLAAAVLYTRHCSLAGNPPHSLRFSPCNRCELMLFCVGVSCKTRFRWEESITLLLVPDCPLCFSRPTGGQLACVSSCSTPISTPLGLVLISLTVHCYIFYEKKERPKKNKKKTTWQKQALLFRCAEASGAKNISKCPAMQFSDPLHALFCLQPSSGGGFALVLEGSGYASA